MDQQTLDPELWKMSLHDKMVAKHEVGCRDDEYSTITL
jgi:hypothetical protein